MVALQRANLIDPARPTPRSRRCCTPFCRTNSSTIPIRPPSWRWSIRRGSEALSREVFGKTMGFVPYIKPGFDLAKAAAEVFEADPSVDGLILDKHGIFTFGDSAQEAYDRMIAPCHRGRGLHRRAWPRRPVRPAAAADARQPRRDRADVARRGRGRRAARAASTG